MKNTFTRNVLFVVFYHLFHLCGVFGADADEVKSVMEGDSVTLHTHLTHIQSYSLTLWRFGDEGVTIVRINRDKIIYSDIPAFRDRMVLDDQTGSLTITNSRPKHSGLYKIEINNSTGTSLKKFRLTVYNSPLLIEAEKGELKTVSVTEGDPASLMMEVVEIQRYDLIVWRFGDDGILIVKGDREDNKTTFSHDETYGDRLELNYQTGSLTITDARITDAGLYKAKISGDRRAEYMRIILTVSASGVSSGGVAGIVIVVLMALSGAVGVFVFFYRRRTSEIKKQNDVFVDKSVLIKPEDSVILDTGVKEIHEKDEITWMYEGASIAKMRGDQTVENMDARFRGKLKLNPQNGSLTIKDTKTELAGLYKVKMRLQDLPSAQIINVSASDKLSVNEGDSFTLSSGHTELRDSVMTWRLGDKHIATVNGSQASVCVEERFKDRVHVDPQTGSLTVRNSRTEDSGLYQLQIGGREKSERKFTVRVREKIKKVSANEAASLTLHTEVAFTRRPDMIKWMFGDICIAGYVGKSPAHDVNNDRFKNRLEMDPATGSLTIANTKTTDSGRYTLMISPDLTGDSQRKFFVTVRGRPLWKKCPQLREDESDKLPMNQESHIGTQKQTETTVNAQDESEPEVTPDSLSSEQTDKLSVKKGDSFTLSSGHTELSDSVMTWRLGDKHIATVNGSQASVFDEERFKDRVHVDPQTGSLTVRNSRTEDSGLYRLQIGGGDYSTEKSERKIIVNVCEKMNTVAVMEGDSFTLHIEDIQRADTIKWMFKKFKKTTCIAENVGNTPAAALDVDKDDRFRGRLELDRKTGSLTITDTRKTDSGRYTLMINPPINGNSEWKFSVTLNDKLSVKKGDSFTLSSGHTELRDSVMTWRLGDKHIATINGSQASVFDEERFKDRVHVDPQTGSLTVRNSRTEDSGLYRLQIGGGDYSTEKSERKIIVNVCEKMNTVAVMEGDSFTLHIEDIQRADTIKWMFKKFKKTTCIAENVGNTPAAALDVDKDDRFRGRLELDRKTGSLTITDTRKTDSGRYTLMINPPINGNSEWKFSVTLNDKLSVKKGDSFTLSSGHTELRDSVMTWRLGDKHIATVNGSQASVCVEERFKDRVHVDPQTGSLTVRNSRTEDSGLYQLQISAREKSERKFTVTVRDRRILRKKNPKPRKAPSTENQGNDSDSTHTEDPSDRDALLSDSEVNHLIACELSDHRMRTTPLLFVYLLLCCQTTESLTLKRVILGGNVTLDCELDYKEIYWFISKPPESPVLILRTFSSESTSAVFYDQRLKRKYSLKQLSCLFISYITKDELGTYYCAKANTMGLNFSNGTKLYTETVHQNSTEENDHARHDIKHQTVAITSISCIALFLIIIGLLTLKCEKRRKPRQPYQNVKVKQLDDLNTEEFTKVEFHLLLCCRTTESLTLKPVILGGDVTLYCHLVVSDIFWLFLKPPESLVVIMRTSKSYSTSADFYDPRLQIKYSSKLLSRLFISNITHDELGIYYCAKVVSLQLSNGTKLYTETVHQNSTEENDHARHELKLQTVAITSISCIALLLIIIGLLTLKCEKLRKPYQNFKIFLCGHAAHYPIDNSTSCQSLADVCISLQKNHHNEDHIAFILLSPGVLSNYREFNS
ncbi:hypothetical protein IRJ41_011044 [Triplophysa rosa]|uniref:Immunoglobulin domain-containing protein n=1 Tax=Triplophysa rosa TaxID=992332 RepID=A0A9W7W9J4_TRIRA|nr:hypothetical protein IRJ41_011044 [Triplophysa rosa]